MTFPPYTKKPSTIAEQMTLLKDRGLEIADPALLEHFLTHVGYYRLAGYWQIFQNDPVTHTFTPGTTFEQIVELYDFDRELRILLYDAIERIEISFRGNLTHQLCIPYGAYWFKDDALIRDAARHEENKLSISDEVDRSKEEFIKHHDAHYGNVDFPPAWKTIHVLSFGTISKIYTNLKSSLPEKNAIARTFGLPNYIYMESWMQTISVLRNHCAHHSRIANRVFDFPPKRLRTSPHPWITQLPATQQEASLLYTQLCAVKLLMHQCSPGNHFTTKLKTLIVKYPGVNIRRMGFPRNWDGEDLWTH
jgi:abortive infection bacteriophage resistance protein